MIKEGGRSTCGWLFCAAFIIGSVFFVDVGGLGVFVSRWRERGQQGVLQRILQEVGGKRMGDWSQSMSVTRKASQLSQICCNEVAVCSAGR